MLLLISTRARLWQLLMSNCRHPQGARQHLTHKNSSKKEKRKEKTWWKGPAGGRWCGSSDRWRLHNLWSLQTEQRWLSQMEMAPAVFHLSNDSQVELKDNQLWFLRSCLRTVISSLCPPVSRNNQLSSYQVWQHWRSGSPIGHQITTINVSIEGFSPNIIFVFFCE